MLENGIKNAFGKNVLPKDKQLFFNGTTKFFFLILTRSLASCLYMGIRNIKKAGLTSSLLSLILN